MKLNSLNSNHQVVTKIKQISCLAEFSAIPHQDPDVGSPFDFVPDHPGVLCFLNADGTVHSIDAALKSMRSRLMDLYRGTAGDGRRPIGLFGFVQSTKPTELRSEIVRDHVREYSSFPAAKKA